MVQRWDGWTWSMGGRLRKGLDRGRAGRRPPRRPKRRAKRERENAASGRQARDDALEMNKTEMKARRRSKGEGEGRARGRGRQRGRRVCAEAVETCRIRVEVGKARDWRLAAGVGRVGLPVSPSGLWGASGGTLGALGALGTLGEALLRSGPLRSLLSSLLPTVEYRPCR